MPLVQAVTYGAVNIIRYGATTYIPVKYSAYVCTYMYKVSCPSLRAHGSQLLPLFLTPPFMAKHAFKCFSWNFLMPSGFQLAKNGSFAYSASHARCKSWSHLLQASRPSISSRPPDLRNFSTSRANFPLPCCSPRSAVSISRRK